MTRLVLAFAITLAAAPAFAAPQAATSTPPTVVRGTVTARGVAPGLAAAIRTAGATADIVWVGYAVPASWPDRDGGDIDWWACRIEPEATPRVPGLAPAGAPLALEPSTEATVLVRVVDQKPERVRVVSRTCALDLGDRPLVWLTGVPPADSVAYLSGLATAGGTKRLADGALTAIARHADNSALDWLATTARTAESSHLRGQALFWLAQRAGDRAVGVIDEAVRRDPDTAVKRRAVFALSQLPADQGVPRLIALAREHSNPVVRKQAFFWLGQSRDPRALSFLTGILAR